MSSFLWWLFISGNPLVLWKHILIFLSSFRRNLCPQDLVLSFLALLYTWLLGLPITLVGVLSSPEEVLPLLTSSCLPKTTLGRPLFQGQLNVSSNLELRESPILNRLVSPGSSNWFEGCLHWMVQVPFLQALPEGWLL